MPDMSVLMTTYNHQQYIEQAVLSVMEQETTFSVQLCIGDDDSTDGTCDILTRLKDQYPDRIHLLLHPHNLGLAGKINLITTREACIGKYIAMLEGDDYWSDPHKLQKQWDFMEANSDFALCFHPVRIHTEGTPESEDIITNSGQADVTTLETLIKGNYIQTPSCVYRNHLFDLPEWFSRVILGDWGLHILHAQYGKVKCLPDVMAVYRIHAAGYWTGKSDMERIIQTLSDLALLNRGLEYKYNNAFQESAASFANQLIRVCGGKSDIDYFRGEAMRLRNELALLKEQLAH